jgi:hypothetical protein
MKKKILIGIGAFILILIIGFMYIDYRNKTLSPPGEVKYNKNDLTVEISYGRPSQKGRLIFGTEDEGALLSYGKYWRLGANWATEITISRDVLFNGNKLDSGSYSMYSFPGEHEFVIVLNSELGNWGAFDPDHSLDVLETKVPVEKSNDAIEQFTIRFEEKDTKVLVVCEWSDTKIKIPLEPN